MPIRRDLAQLSDTDRNKYVQAVLALKKSGVRVFRS